MASLLSRDHQPVCRKEDSSTFDISTVYRGIAPLTDAEKFHFIQSIWKPDLLFEFPASKETSGKQRAEQEIVTLQNAIKAMQKNIEGHHHRLFEDTVQLSQKVGIQPSRPRIVQHQIFQ